MKIEVNAAPRGGQGTGASRRLRHSGKVPGILYGGDKPAQPIELDHQELFHKMKQEAFHASILTMNLDGNKEDVLLRDVQMHPWKFRVQHVDFQRVSKNQKIHMKVPLHFINAGISPGVKVGGGVISHVMNDVNVSCLPDHLPEFIEVDLSTLELGHSVHLSDLVLPEGVTAVRSRGMDPVVATVQIPKALIIEEEVPAAAEAAVPVEGAVAEGAAPGPEGAAPAPAEAKAEVAKKGPEKKEAEKK